MLLSDDEKRIIDGVLDDAKMANLRKRGFGTCGQIDFQTDEIRELLAKVSPTKALKKVTDSESRVNSDTMENEFVAAMQSDLGQRSTLEPALDLEKKNTEIVIQDNESSSHSIDSDCSFWSITASEEKLPNTEMVVQENETSSHLMDSPRSSCSRTEAGEDGPPSQETLLNQQEYHDRTDKDSNCKVCTGSPKTDEADSTPNTQLPLHKEEPRSSCAGTVAGQKLPPSQESLLNRKVYHKLTSPEMNDTESKHKSQLSIYAEERNPIVWDWKRLYGIADIHTVTWESDMLSSLCHIVGEYFDFSP